MSGEHDLGTLLRSLNAVLHPGTYVFVTRAGQGVPPDLVPRMVFQEAEGTTFIVLREEADALGWSYEFPCRMITLNVHSALDAVGFLARVTTALAAGGMGVNPVAGFFHDHLFIPHDRAKDAMAILAKLAAET